MTGLRMIKVTGGLKIIIKTGLVKRITTLVMTAGLRIKVVAVGPSAAAASTKRPADSDEVSWRYVEETTDSALALPESSPGATSSKEAPPELSTVLPAGGESSVLHDPAASTTEGPNKMSKMICEMIMRRKRRP